MIFGVALFVIGYAVFYWGVHHFNNCLGIEPGVTNNCPRYSLWQLLGAGNLNIGKTPPVQLQTG